ncbi:MAG TPA: efflux RND transporter periplasmic adaptor subunit [Flavitalea sp.]|nr:efflux RND transporter periplasmic adaptor subunit [Flavitalea sp.]
MRKKTWIIIGSLLAIIIVFVFLKTSGVIGKEEGVKVTAEKAAKRTIIETVNASGKVYPEIEVKVSPDISGEITELKVLEGDSVKKGQVLAKIYADIYTTQRDQASAIVTQEQSRMENSRAQLPGLLSARDFAKKTYDRQKQLVDDKVISRAEFEQALSQYQTAEANYNAAVEVIRGGQASVLGARASLQKADKDLSRTAVLAPMNGVVSLLSVKRGERVVGNSMMAGTEMMRIADMSKIEVRVDVGENDIPKVSLGDSALVEVDAYNSRKFRGVVTQIAASSALAASQQSASSSQTSTDVTNYMVYIRLLPSSYTDLIDPSRPKNFPFRPGMSASADIQTNVKTGVLSVPINGVSTREKDSNQAAGEKKKDEKAPETGLQEDDKSTLSNDLDEVVFTVDKLGVVKKHKVKTGIQDINYIEVLSGLTDSANVISAPYNVVSKTLKEGMKVKVVPKEQLFTPTK